MEAMLRMKGLDIAELVERSPGRHDRLVIAGA